MTGEAGMLSVRLGGIGGIGLIGDCGTMSCLATFTPFPVIFWPKKSNLALSPRDDVISMKSTFQSSFPYFVRITSFNIPKCEVLS